MTQGKGKPGKLGEEPRIETNPYGTPAQRDDSGDTGPKRVATKPYGPAVLNPGAVEGVIGRQTPAWGTKIPDDAARRTASGVRAAVANTNDDGHPADAREPTLPGAATPTLPPEEVRRLGETDETRELLAAAVKGIDPAYTEAGGSTSVIPGAGAHLNPTTDPRLTTIAPVGSVPPMAAGAAKEPTKTPTLPPRFGSAPAVDLADPRLDDTTGSGRTDAYRQEPPSAPALPRFDLPGDEADELAKAARESDVVPARANNPHIGDTIAPRPPTTDRPLPRDGGYSFAGREISNPVTDITPGTEERAGRPRVAPLAKKSIVVPPSKTTYGMVFGKDGGANNGPTTMPAAGEPAVRPMGGGEPESADRYSVVMDESFSEADHQAPPSAPILNLGGGAPSVVPSTTPGTPAAKAAALASGEVSKLPATGRETPFAKTAIVAGASGAPMSVLPTTGRESPWAKKTAAQTHTPVAPEAAPLTAAVPTKPEAPIAIDAAGGLDTTKPDGGRSSRQVTTVKTKPAGGMPTVASTRPRSSRWANAWGAFCALILGAAGAEFNNVHNDIQNDNRPDIAVPAGLPTPAPAPASSARSLTITDAGVVQAPAGTQTVVVHPAPVAAAAPYTVEMPKTLTSVELPAQLASGELKMVSNNIVRDIWDSFNGAATTEAQKMELKNLRQKIWLGLAVYFNEHFAAVYDAEKATGKIDLEKSSCDPKLRNLYATAKISFNYNWINREKHTKTHSAQTQEAYDLVARMLAEGHDLGWDKSSSATASAREKTNGNMFNAKSGLELMKNGKWERKGNPDVVKLRHADGRNHIIVAIASEILGGQTAKQAVDQELQRRQVALAASQGASTTKPTAVDAGSAGSNVNNKQFLPNIAPDKAVNVGNKDADDLENIDKGWDDIPSAADNEAAQMKEIDAGWDAIADAATEQANTLATEKALFEKNGRLTIEFDYGATTKQENQSIVPKVADKIAAFYPEADGEAVRALVKRFGFVAFEIKSRGAGKAEIILKENFRKNILAPALKNFELKKKARASA